MAGAVVPAPPPPENVVREKLAITFTFLFRNQFRPTDQADADRAEVVASAKSGNVSGSIYSFA